MVEIIENLKEYFQRHNIRYSFILLLCLIGMQFAQPFIHIDNKYLYFLFVVSSSIAIIALSDFLQNIVLKDPRKHFELSYYKRSIGYVKKQLNTLNISFENVPEKELSILLYKSKRKKTNKENFILIIVFAILSVMIFFIDYSQRAKDEKITLIKQYYECVDLGIYYREKGNMDKSAKYFEKAWNMFSDEKKRTANIAHGNDSCTTFYFETYSDSYENTVRHEIMNIRKAENREGYLVLIDVEEKLHSNPMTRVIFYDTTKCIDEKCGIIMRKIDEIFHIKPEYRDTIERYIKCEVLNKCNKACNNRLLAILKSQLKLDFKEGKDRKIEHTYDLRYITVNRNKKLHFDNFTACENFMLYD